MGTKVWRKTIGQERGSFWEVRRPRRGLTSDGKAVQPLPGSPTTARSSDPRIKVKSRGPARGRDRASAVLTAAA